MSDPNQQIDPASASDAQPDIPGQQMGDVDKYQDWTASTPQDGGGPGSLDTSGASDKQAPSPQTTPPTRDQNEATNAANTTQFQYPGTTSAADKAAAASQALITPDISKAPPQVQQAVQTGGYAHAILQALAGGPRTKTTIDPMTGTVTRSKQSLTNGQAGMAVALAALTGAFNGLAQKGPGAEGRAAAGGFDSAIQQRQQQNDDEESEASKTYARQAAIAQTNFLQHETAQRMGMLDYDFHQKVVANNAPAIDAIDKVGAIQARGVKESDLLTKYNVTKDSALVDGTVARVDADGKQVTDKYGQPVWDNTYAVVDPSKKIALSQSMAQNLADHHVAGYFTMVDGKAVPKDFNGSAQVRAGLVLNGIAQSNAIDTTEGQLNQQLSRVGGDAKQFDANLTKALDNQSVSGKDLTTFAKYASMPFDQAIDQMRKDKVDPQTIGNISKLIPDDVQKAMTKQRLDQDSTEEAQRVADATHTKAASALPDDLKKLGMEEQVRGKFSFQNAFNAEAGRVAAKNKYGEGGGAVNHEMVNNPKLAQVTQGIDPNTPLVNGVRPKVLDNIATADPALAAEIRAVGEGRSFLSKYGLAKGDGQRLASLVQLAYPEYNQAKADAYDKLQQRFTAGDVSDQLRSLNTTFEHSKETYDLAGNASASIPGSSAKAEYEVAKSQLTEELNHAYTKGVLHDARREELQNGLNSPFPYVRQNAVKESQKLLSDFAGEFQNQWRNGKVTSAAADAPIASPEGQAAFNDLFKGERRMNRYGTTVSLGSNFKPPVGALPGKDAKGNTVAYQLRDGTYTDTQGNEITQ